MNNYYLDVESAKNLVTETGLFKGENAPKFLTADTLAALIAGHTGKPATREIQGNAVVSVNILKYRLENPALPDHQRRAMQTALERLHTEYSIPITHASVVYEQKRDGHDPNLR